MKSIIPLSVITALAVLALVGCNQSSPSNSTGTPSSNSRMSDANGTMGGATNMNMSATNSMPNMDMSTNKAAGAANDATRWDEWYGRKIGGPSQGTSTRTQMIARRHNGMLSNVHASQAGIAGDWTSDAYKPALAVIGALVVILLVVVISKLSKK